MPPAPEQHHPYVFWMTAGAVGGAVVVIKFAWKLAQYRVARANHKAAKAMVPLTKKLKWTAFKLMVGAGLVMALLYLFMSVVSVLDLKTAGESRPTPSPSHPVRATHRPR